MQANVGGCCRGPPKCSEEDGKKVCAYYNDEGHNPGGKVRLGGIFDPKQSRHSVVMIEKNGNDPDEVDMESQKNQQEERRLQCQQAMKKWSFDFLKKIPHPLAPCSGSQAQIAKKRFKDMERVQSATENIVEKFGGLTLGFSGPLPPPQVIQYHGLKVVHRQYQEPDYPDDLRMKGVRRPRVPRTQRAKRSWENEDSADNQECPIRATFSPTTALSPESSSTKSTSRLPEAGDDRHLLFLGGRDAIQGKVDSSRVSMGAPSGTGFRTIKRATMPPSADELILEYVDKFNLEMMFEYFLALACLYTPDNAFQFISDLAGKMVDARTNDTEFQNLERIFTKDHVAALFRLFDKEQNGYITHRQYKTGMETLGLVNYTKDPEGFQQDRIVEKTFVDEA